MSDAFARIEPVVRFIFFASAIFGVVAKSFFRRASCAELHPCSTRFLRDADFLAVLAARLFLRAIDTPLCEGCRVRSFGLTLLLRRSTSPARM